MMGTKGFVIQKLETRNVRVFIASLDLPTLKLKTLFITITPFSRPFFHGERALRQGNETEKSTSA